MILAYTLFCSLSKQLAVQVLIHPRHTYDYEVGAFCFSPLLAVLLVYLSESAHTMVKTKNPKVFELLLDITNSIYYR
jgi:hypothetical protein